MQRVLVSLNNEELQWLAGLADKERVIDHSKAKTITKLKSAQARIRINQSEGGTKRPIQRRVTK